MEFCKSDLQEIQEELQAVKKALRNGGSYLGMQGEPLQRYLLQLSEKENIHLSRHLQSQAGGLAPAANGKGGYGNASGANFLASASGEAANGASPMGKANGVLEPPEEQVVVPRPPPEGDIRSMDKDSLASVVQHLVDYEANAQESQRAVKALSSLAYADAPKLGDDDRILPQVLRVLAIHPKEDGLQLVAMRAFSNMAYNQDLALHRLGSSPGVMQALIHALARTTGSKEIGSRAGEAVARIVAAEVGPTPAEIEAGAVAPTPPATSPLSVLFAVTCRGRTSEFGAVQQLIMQLITNEVVEASLVSRRFAESANIVKSTAAGSFGWLTFAKQFSQTDNPQLVQAAVAQAMVDANAIASATSVMGAQEREASVQLAGIECLSSLVGNRWSGLQKFAADGGMQFVQAALEAHPTDAILQTKGIRAMASGTQWPEDIRNKSKYSWKRGVELTKLAMKNHEEDLELQVAALEALCKYVEKLHCAGLVKEEGGEETIRSTLTRHASVARIQSWGKNLMGQLGLRI
eukprot:TRINITY_DN1518_c0_g2_i1.p1 TRINITY_DN1518_c0_g2~~TRINITY_DN1518_c0_g2_i1.p1  ORF type:complete len:521 (+),score=117.85 TRINITY_DN1518_c0_g2_i1:49-1611(+)